MPRATRLPLVARAVAVAVARIGDGWGTNIHWTSESAVGEAAQLAAAFRLARMDFSWGGIERSCGTYDFSAYDALLGTMKAHEIRPYWILDYGNPCYPAAPGSPRQSCSTPACTAAFGRFAAATVARFAGNGVIFECLNEPNGMGGDSAGQITQLCLAAGAHFLAAGETFVGPTTAGMDWAYLNATFADGILPAFSNVSVHPYRSGPPDSVIDDWATVRGLIGEYAGPGQVDMGLLSGEWGYTSALPPCNYGNRVNDMEQGVYLARMWLSNTIAGVPISIAYDWRDDGFNATNCESNFGSVRDVPTGNASSPYPPKPFYTAALTLQSTLGNAEAYTGRVRATAMDSPSARPFDVLIARFETGGAHPSLFTSSSGVAFAVWQNATSNATCALPPPVTDRLDCGFYGISEQQCSTRACCWESSQPKVGGPQCYFSVLPSPPFPVSFPASPAPPGTCFAGRDTFGNALGAICADSSGTVTLQAAPGPVYLL